MQIYHQKRQFDRTKKKEVVSLGEGSFLLHFIVEVFKNLLGGYSPPPLCASSPTKEKKSYFDFNKK
jgi:hypothetical protein